jgi:hypothetical protein
MRPATADSARWDGLARSRNCAASSDSAMSTPCTRPSRACWRAVERGDLPPRQADPSGGHSIAVSAALALLLHWALVRGRQVSDDDIAAIVDAVLMPLL